MAGAQIYGLKPADGSARAAPEAAPAREFAAAAELARAISGAATVCIRILTDGAARLSFFPPRDGVADLPQALVQGGVVGALGEEMRAAGLEGVRFWAGFPLRDASGRVLGLLGVMDDLPRALPDAALRQLQLLADVLAAEVAQAEAALRGSARRMLRLIEDVAEVDDGAASPALLGLLRFATGEVPHSTEAMALRIAGLAEARGARLVLTHAAHGILAQQGYDAATEVEVEARPAAPAVVAEPEPEVDFSPVARLRIGETSHDIARSEALDALGFRMTGSTAAWQVLTNGLEEGWPEIIAEVLKKTRDVVHEYVRMHMIHVRDAILPEGQYHYDLYGMGWTVRGTPEHAEVSVDGVTWQVFDAAGVTWDQPRDLSALGALAGYPDIAERIGDDVHEWCKRIAAGSEVTPIF